MINLKKGKLEAMLYSVQERDSLPQNEILSKGIEDIPLTSQPLTSTWVTLWMHENFNTSYKRASMQAFQTAIEST